MRKPDLSYVKLEPKGMEQIKSRRWAKVVCTCGWESGRFVCGPFDPAEALVAYSVEHLFCKSKCENCHQETATEGQHKIGITGGWVCAEPKPEELMGSDKPAVLDETPVTTMSDETRALMKKDCDIYGIAYARIHAYEVQHIPADEMLVQYAPGRPAANIEPIPMRLNCPSCGELHIDQGEYATKMHHTHACQHCGMVWRPAIVPTFGVYFLPGFKNKP